jgi:hypothetical protein
VARLLEAGPQDMITLVHPEPSNPYDTSANAVQIDGRAVSYFRVRRRKSTGPAAASDVCAVVTLPCPG